MRVIPHWINGRTVADAASVAELHVTNPATGEVTGAVRAATTEVVDQAVDAARAAAPAWRARSISRRTRILFKYRELLDAHRDDLAELVTREHGKVTADALGEVNRGIEVVEFACGLGELLKGERNEDASTGYDTYSARQPVGVVAGITPFNFPVMVPMWMFPVAIACGNTFVLKPSEKDPTVSIRLAELFQEAGLPDGVFNVVQGEVAAVTRLLEHPDIDAVSFVGSTPIAKIVHRTASETGKRVQALGGAKNHMVVLPDADVEFAADAAVNAGYGSAGERCMAISVVVAVGDIADPLVDAIVTRIDKLRVGNGLDPAGVDMGPLVTGEHRDKVARYIDIGEQEGARLVRDGRGLRVDGYEHGFWVGPTLFDNVSASMQIYRDEIFGPVLGVVRVDSYEAAIQLLHDNPYGNGVAVFTKDGRAARMFRRDVPVGMVGVNVPIPVPMAYHSFGGWKASLFGDHHIHGPEGVRFYTRHKTVTEFWPAPTDGGVDLGFPSGT